MVMVCEDRYQITLHTLNADHRIVQFLKKMTTLGRKSFQTSLDFVYGGIRCLSILIRKGGAAASHGDVFAWRLAKSGIG